MSGRRLLDSDDEVLRLAEAGGRDPFVLLVGNRDARAHHLAHDGRETVGSNGEGKALLRRARNVHHRELAFPRLTDPSLVRELLDVASPMPRFRVRVRERDCRPCGQKEYRYEHHAEQNPRPTAPAPVPR